MKNDTMNIVCSPSLYVCNIHSFAFWVVLVVRILSSLYVGFFFYVGLYFMVSRARLLDEKD